jgi:hypothetical protein
VARRQWLTAIAGADGDASLHESLDAHASRTGADVLARDAEAARRQRAAERAQAVTAAREAKAKAARGLGRLLAAHQATAA